MTIEAWRDDIVDALNRNLTAHPDRAGSTPLSRLADKMEALSPTSGDADEALSALVSLIEDPEMGFEDQSEKKYWRGLTGLCRSLQTHNWKKIESAFYARLFGPRSLVSDLRVFALNGVIMAGKKLNPKDLEKLKEDGLLETNPVSWLYAAVISSNLDLAVETAKGLLKADKLNINAFALTLDDWNDHWKEGVDFGDVITDLRDNATSQAAKNKLQKWMDRRNITAYIQERVQYKKVHLN